MCSGKSTLANKIIKYYKKKGIVIVKRSFSELVYKIARDVFKMKQKNRKLLQQIGTKMREIDKNVFVNYIINDLSENVIIDDCRYINEFDALYKAKFILIKINLPKKIQEKRLIKTYPDTWKIHMNNINHSSETTIENMDNKKITYTINYNYDFNDICIFLQKNLRKFIYLTK